jgi:hypothetical protein
MPELILKIAHRYSAIETPDSKAMSEQMRMDTMSILPSLILTLDLLQASVGGNVVKDILDLARGDMSFTIAREQPTLRAASELF